MTRSSRSILNIPVPCEPAAAAKQARRLHSRLSLEARSSSLMAGLAAVGSAWSLFLPEPFWVRLLYSALFASVSLMSLIYRGRRAREAKAVEALASRLEKGEQPAWLCDATLGDLLEKALEDYGRGVGRE